MKPRLLIIGIDGADYSITRRLLVEGRLPVLASLAEGGTWGPVRSTIPPVTPPAWTTLMTGKNPGKHGVFDFLPMAGEPASQPIAARRRAMTFFAAISRASLRVGTFNLPGTYPPERLSAFQVSGFDAPSFRPEMAHPRQAFEVLVREVGEYDLYAMSIQRPEGDWEAVERHALLPLVATRALLRAFPCDVYMTSFQVVDWVHHAALGREMTPDDPNSLAPDGVVVRTYELVDRRVGELIDEWAGPDTLVMVVSDHGGTAADCLVNMEKLFLDHGLMAYTAATREETASALAQRRRAETALRWWTWAKSRLPWAIRPFRALARALRGRVASYEEKLQIDLSRTKAIPFGNYGQVRFRVRGRDPEGIVDEAEVPALFDHIADLLLSLKDPASREPVYAKVLPGAEVYEGPYIAEGPDLVALAASERYFTVSARHGVGRLPLLDVQPHFLVTLDPPWGVHAWHGILMLRGPQIQQGGELGQATLADVAPTLLYLLDQPVPEDMDGRVLAEVIKPELASSRQPRQGPPWPEPEPLEAEAVSLAEDQARVEERLRNLGYL